MNLNIIVADLLALVLAIMILFVVFELVLIMVMSYQDFKRNNTKTKK